MENTEKHPKNETKANIVSVTHPDDSNVRISNYIKIADKQHACFVPPRGLKSS